MFYAATKSGPRLLLFFYYLLKFHFFLVHLCLGMDEGWVCKKEVKVASPYSTLCYFPGVEKKKSGQFWNPVKVWVRSSLPNNDTIFLHHSFLSFSVHCTDGDKNPSNVTSFEFPLPRWKLKKRRLSPFQSTGLKFLLVHRYLSMVTAMPRFITRNNRIV